jgi:ribulose 1,5-bisphosphate synthetase/thiazole synthase
VTVLAEVTVIFNISDAYKAIVDTTDFASTILESAQEASIEPITTRTFDDCCVAVSNKGLRSELTPALRKSLRLYGVYVEKAFISDFSRTKVLCHEGSINTGGCESE